LGARLALENRAVGDGICMRTPNLAPEEALKSRLALKHALLLVVDV
jgi:hypothetical protein